MCAYDESAHLLGEYDGSGNLIEETVWLGDIPVASLRPHAGGGIDIYYVHTDQLNTPRQVTRPSDNAQLWTWYSDPFGTDAANGNPAGAGAFAYNLRLPGQVFDGQAGLHDNFNRDYDPATGRYVESDPIGLAGGSYSTYSYVDEDPIVLIDPSGLADLNLFDPNPQGHGSTGNYAGGNVWNIPGVYTVAGHGNPGNMEDDRKGTWPWKPLSPALLAAMIRADPNWKHKPVKLGGCNTGLAWEPGHYGITNPEPFAQTLADLLGVPVAAPLGFTRWSATQGLLGVTGTMTGPITGPGKWQTFSPVK